jgi:hypothetical protein
VNDICLLSPHKGIANQKVKKKFEAFELRMESCEPATIAEMKNSWGAAVRPLNRYETFEVSKSLSKCGIAPWHIRTGSHSAVSLLRLVTAEMSW